MKRPPGPGGPIPAGVAAGFAAREARCSPHRRSASARV